MRVWVGRKRGAPWPSPVAAQLPAAERWSLAGCLGCLGGPPSLLELDGWVVRRGTNARDAVASRK